MADIVDFNKALNSKGKNVEILHEFESKFCKILKRNIKKIKEKNNVNNFDILYKNYEDIIKLFKNGIINTDTLILFLNKLKSDTENQDDEINYVYHTLYFFHCYKIYKDKFLDLFDEDIRIAISVYELFEQEEKINDLNQLLDGFFKKELFNKFKSLCKDEKDILYNYANAFDDFLYEKQSDIPFLYYFNVYVSYFEESKKDEEDYVPVFSKGILTPELVYEELKDRIYLFSALLYSSAKESNVPKQMQKACNFVNLLDNMVFMLKNMDEPKRTDCLIYIRDVWTNEENNLETKITLTFDKILELYDKSKVSKKK